MENYTIGCDAHKYYSQISVMDNNARVCKRTKIEHTSGAIQKYLEQFPAGTQVALECVGNWYWIVDEIEAAGCIAQLTNAWKAKVMMGHVNKTDKLELTGWHYFHTMVLYQPYGSRMGCCEMSGNCPAHECQ